MHYATVISIHAVRHTIDFNPEINSLSDRYNMKAMPEGSEPTLELAQAVDMGLDPSAIYFHSVVLWTQAMGFHRIELPSIAQYQSTANLTSHLRPPACSGRVELRLLHGQLGIVGIDGTLHQSDVGMSVREMIAGRRHAVEPSNVRLPVPHLAAV